MPKKISLKQFLMRTGKFEKVYDAVKSIREGRITINNKITINPNHFFNPKKALVRFQGEKLKPVPKLYFLMNKPAELICQKSDKEKNIYDLIKKLNIWEEEKSSLFAVGRLDKETEGLLIITNDGKLSDLLMNPEKKIQKKYYATLEKPVDINKIKRLEHGVEIFINGKPYKTKKCKIKITGEKEVYVTIVEGKKRQIRKMFESIGNNAVYLKRVSIGGLALNKLKEGEIKQISREEIFINLGFNDNKKVGINGNSDRT